MKPISKYEIDINMVLKGSKAIESQLSNLFNNLPVLQKRFDELNLSRAMSKSIKNLKNDITAEYAKLENALQVNSSAQNKGSEQEKAAALRLLKTAYESVLTSMGNIIIENERLTQVSKSAFSVQEAKLQETIGLLDKYGIKLRGLKKLQDGAISKSVAGNSAAPLAKFNTELDARTQKLIKIKELMSTMDNLGLDSSRAKEYRAELVKVARAFRSFNTPIKEAEVAFQGLKVNPKLLVDMQDFSKYAEGVVVELTKARATMNSSSTSYKQISQYLKNIRDEQKKVAVGGKIELDVANKNVKLMDTRYQKAKQLNDQADRLLQQLNDNRDVTNEIVVATNKVIDELRNGAKEQMDLTKSTIEHNTVLKKSLDFEGLLNKNLKERVTTEKKILTLQSKQEAQLADIERLLKSRKSFATTKALTDAKEEAARLKGNIADTIQLLAKVRNVGTIDGNIDARSLSILKKEADGLAAAFTRDNLKIREMKANLAELSNVKWGTNILKRATAYASMYAGIYEVINLMRSGVGSVVEFDTQMRTIQAVFDVTSSTAKNLTKDLMGLGRAWGGSVTDINDAALSLGRAGIATEKVGEATEVVIKMAKLTGDSIATSASAVITYQQVFGATHPVLKEVGDQLAYVANQSRLSTQDIGTFSNYALSAAKSAGLSMEAINAMATSFSNAGVNASTIGTQIRRFSSLMRDNSSAAQEFFLKLGTTQAAFSAEMQKGKRSADEALTWISKKLKSLSNSEFQKTIAGMDILASNSITLLRNNADEFLRHFKNLNEGVQGEIDKANLISDGYQASFEKMKIAASEAFISLSESSAPVVKKLLDDMAAYFDYVKAHSGEIVDKISQILNTAKWAALGFMILKSVTLLSTFSSSVSLLATGMVGFGSTVLGVVTKMTWLSEAFGVATIAIRAFLASNPLGWAILGATAIGGATYALYEYATGTDEVTNSTDKLNDSLTESERINSSISKNREELGTVMKKLRDTTHVGTKAEYERAAQLELSIIKEKEQLKVLKEKQKIQEMRAQIKVRENQSKIITEEIKIAEAEGNPRVIATLERRHKRLQEDIGTIKIKVGLAKAKSEYISEVTTLVNDYQSQFRRLEDMKASSAPEVRIKAASIALEVYKKRLQDVYHLDISTFKGKDIEVEIEKLMSTAQGKLNSLELALKFSNKLSPETKQALQDMYDELLTQFKNHGSLANVVFTDDDLTNFGAMASAISKQFKEGLDVAPQMEYLRQEFTNGMKALSAEIEGLYGELNQALDKAVANMDMSKVSADFGQALNSMKLAEKEFADAQTSFGKQVAYNEYLNALALLKTKYPEVAATVIQAANNIGDSLDDVNKKVQTLTGEFTKTTDGMLGGQKTLNTADSLMEKIDNIRNTTAKIPMNFEEINVKLRTGVDLSWQIRNGSLKAGEADNIRVKIVNTLINLYAQLAQTKEAYDYILKQDAIAGQGAKDALKANLLSQIENISKEAKNQIKNYEAILSKQKRTTNVSKNASNNASNTTTKNAVKAAEARERSVKALKEMEASYREKLGDYSQSTALSTEAEFKRIEKLGVEADATAEKIRELKKLYIQGEEKGIRDNMASDTASNVQSPTLDTYNNGMKDYETTKERYSQLIALNEAHMTQLATKRSEGSLQEEEYLKEKQATELENMRLHNEAKAALDQSYLNMKLDTYGAAFGELGDIMSSMYSSGLVQTKGWLVAMKGLYVAQAIMSTYTAASAALTAAPPPYNYLLVAATIAQGMAQVAQIKAQKFHTGGYVDKPLASGVGGLKDDEINAVLKKGEYVLTQKEVASLKATNKKASNANVPSNQQATNKSDSSSLQTRELSLLAESLKSEVVIVNSQDPAVIEDWATSRRGREVIQNIINR